MRPAAGGSRFALRQPGGVTRLAAPAAWLAFVLLTQSWNPWAEGIERQYASDVTSYETIARAAPGLPDTDVPLQHAERFVPHWLVGAVAGAAGLPLHDLYRAATALVLLALVLVVDATLVAARTAARARALALGLLVASAYPVHYLLAAPGMLADAVFLLGLAVVLLGFARGDFRVVLAGLVVGTLGRQNMAPLGLAAAVWVAYAPAWRGRRLAYAAACAVVPGILYLALHEAAQTFAQPENAPLTTITVVGSLDQPAALAQHVGRTALALAVPLAVVAVAAAPRKGLPPGPLLLAACVVAETLALGPDWTAHNEPRLAALALPALAVAAGPLLSRLDPTPVQTAAVAVGTALASLHHLYTRLPTDRPAAWAALSVAGAALAAAALAPAARSGARASS